MSYVGKWRWDCNEFGRARNPDTEEIFTHVMLEVKSSSHLNTFQIPICLRAIVFVQSGANLVDLKSYSCSPSCTPSGIMYV